MALGVCESAWIVYGPVGIMDTLSQIIRDFFLFPVQICR